MLKRRGLKLIPEVHPVITWYIYENVYLFQGRVTYRFPYAMRHNGANNMTPCPLPYASCPEFRQNRQFLKPVLNTFILHNLIVGRRRGLLKRGLVFCIKSINLRDMLIVGSCRIHQNKSWYYLGLFQTSKVELFSAINRQLCL